MTDDIVTRLRENCACSGTEQFGYTCTSCDAADEIEQLRHQLQQWKATATLFYQHHDNRRSCSLLASCKACDAYEALTQQTQQQH